MKNIKMFVPLLILAFCAIVMADGLGVKVPTSQMGSQANVEYAGVKGKITSANTTVEVWVSSKPCVLYGVFVSSVESVGNYLVFRDTDAVNGSGTQTISRFDMATSSGAQSITLSYPVRFEKGMTVTLTAGATRPNSYTVLYQERQ